MSDYLTAPLSDSWNKLLVEELSLVELAVDSDGSLRAGVVLLVQLKESLWIIQVYILFPI